MSTLLSVNTFRASVVAFLVGLCVFIAAGDVFKEPPTTLIGWALGALGCLVLGSVILGVAAIVLTLAGCNIQWPGDPDPPPPQEPAP